MLVLVQQRLCASERRTIPKALASAVHAREPHYRQPQRRAQSVKRLKVPFDDRG
jgi:hypothetical protein